MVYSAVHFVLLLQSKNKESRSKATHHFLSLMGAFVVVVFPINVHLLTASGLVVSGYLLSAMHRL